MTISHIRRNGTKWQVNSPEDRGDLRTQKLRSYIELMSLCGFFETAGTLVYKGYIDRDDIMQLYDGTIEQLFTATRIHIERRQEEMPPGYLENFKRLAESIPPRQIS